jgi:predicted nucleotidyltransferase
MVRLKVTKMGLPSKEENVLELFFNHPSKHWHFLELVKEAKMSKQQANKWLKQFLAEKLIIRQKPKGKMPYFIANFEHPNYRNKKKMYALTKLYETGFLSHLQGLPKAELVVIFGSFSRSDWHKDSDIDLFILGDSHGLEAAKYWGKLHHPIEPFIYKDIQEVKEIRSGLVKNILNGYVVKGRMGDLAEALA